MSLPETQWVLLMPDGSVVMDAGDGPRGNVCGLMQEAIAAMFSFPDLPRLFISGPAAVRCAADFVPDVGYTQRVWSFGDLIGDDRRLFVWSSGQVMGIGRTQEEVGAAVQAIQNACRRHGARNLRHHTG